MENNKFQRDAMNIYEKMQTSINIDQNRGTPWTNENQWKSKKFRIPKQFIRGHNVNINIHKKFPRPASYKLQATGGRLQATGNSLQARSNKAARSFRLQARGHRRQATSYRLQATGYKHHVWGWPQDHFVKIHSILTIFWTPRLGC